MPHGSTGIGAAGTTAAPGSPVGEDWQHLVLATVYFIGIVAGPVLMGLALWRSQSVPRWLAVLFFAGLELAQELGSIGPVRIVLLTLPFAVAMVLLAAWIWRAAALPASSTPEPVAMPASIP